VLVAGDAAHVDSTAPIRMACATAMPMGAHAADVVAAELQGREPEPFSFRYMIQCISLGRHNGLVQMVNADDSPRERIITGRTAALVKEIICRFTVWSMALERRPAGAYRWPHGRVTMEAAGVNAPAAAGGAGD
jgi:NADH dehydrogenase FAD-containing subunit